MITGNAITGPTWISHSPMPWFMFPLPMLTDSDIPVAVQDQEHNVLADYQSSHFDWTILGH